MIIFLLVALGLIWGSFVNAFVWRLHEGKDWLRDRSECPHCHHKLAARDLVPVVSWLMLRGKCRYCHARIDDSPLTEVVVPALFIVSYVWWPLPLHGSSLVQFVFWLSFVVGFVVLAVYDIRWYLLPNVVVYPLLGLALSQLLLLFLLHAGGWQAVTSAAAGALIISGGFYVLFQASKGRWIGGGDVKLGALLGILAGGPIEALLLLFLASLSGTLFALPLLFKGALKPKAILPFGPFLLLAAVIVKLFGADIIDWYRSLVYVR